MKRMLTMLTIIISMITIVGTILAVDGRFAKAGDMKKLELRLEQKIYQDRSDNLQQRIWKLEDRYEERETPREVKEEIRELKKEREEIKEYIERETKENDKID